MIYSNKYVYGSITTNRFLANFERNSSTFPLRFATHVEIIGVKRFIVYTLIQVLINTIKFCSPFDDTQPSSLVSEMI